MSETKYPPVVMKWDTVVDHFLMLARNVFERGDKKAFFDAGAAEVNLKDFSKEEQIKIKKSRMVEGGKRRWWELLLLDALSLYYEGNQGKDYKDGKLLKIQKQHESLTNPIANGKPRRSFNQHLALQPVFGAFCEALDDPKYDDFESDVPTILVDGVGIKDTGTFEDALIGRAWRSTCHQHILPVVSLRACYPPSIG